jgi:protein arginine kinase activator
MKCQFCTNPATVHLTKIVDKQKQSIHLCENCAREKKLLPAGAAGEGPAPAADLNLSAVLNLLIGQHVSPVTEELARLTCPTCGLQYMEFRHEGRLGCPADYEVFWAGLEKILERYHRATRHVGKVPRHRDRNAPLQRELLDLRRELRAAVEAERFEDAARLRDLIRQKEAADEPR